MNCLILTVKGARKPFDFDCVKDQSFLGKKMAMSLLFTILKDMSFFYYRTTFAHISTEFCLLNIVQQAC